MPGKNVVTIGCKLSEGCQNTLQLLKATKLCETLITCDKVNIYIKKIIKENSKNSPKFFLILNLSVFFFIESAGNRSKGRYQRKGK